MCDLEAADTSYCSVFIPDIKFWKILLKMNLIVMQSITSDVK